MQEWQPNHNGLDPDLFNNMPEELQNRIGTLYKEQGGNFLMQIVRLPIAGLMNILRHRESQLKNQEKNR